MGMSAREFFKCVFPDGLKGEDYFPLIRVLHEEMSFRSVAYYVGSLLGKDYTLILNDVYAAASPGYISNPEIENRVRERLISCGWTVWLNSPPDDQERIP
jgi:hypothetical protein